VIGATARVLVVDDEPAILRTVRANLGRRGFDVDVASTAEDALARAERGTDLIVLDLGLPDQDGLDLIRALRARGDTPIIVLSVRDGEKDKVRALDLGADDYLTKPFGVEELVARVRVALRHSAGPSVDPVFHSGDLTVDLDKRRVFVGGDEVRLTPTEYALLVVLVRNADRVVTDAGLLRQVWGPEYGDEDHYLHVYVARLRKKIELDAQNPRHLRTEPGVGYRLLTEPPEVR
jgi:two-component system KDP operon response regulator KdpE